MKSLIDSKYEPRLPPIFISEFLEDISSLDLQDQRALTFALVSDCNLDEVVMMQRRGFVNRWGPIARAIVESVAPHIHCEFLFWKSDAPGLASPLFGLRSRFQEATGKSWEEYRGNFGGLIHYWPPKMGEPHSG